MPEGQTEVADKPAEAAPVAEKAAVEAPKEAPATTVAEKPQTGDKKPVEFFIQQREQKREKKSADRIAELEKKLAEFEKAKEPETPASFLDDPDKWAQGVTERAEQRAIEAINRREAESHYRQSAETAANWLLTRSHLKQDQALTKEVAKVIEEKYATVAAVDPNAAARLSYLDVCAAKGISPDMDGFKSQGFDGTSGNATSGVRPSAAASGKRTFSKGEAEKYVFGAKPGTEDYDRRLAEVEEAEKEGRIR